MQLDLDPDEFLQPVNEQTSKNVKGGLNIVIANVCIQKYLSF